MAYLDSSRQHAAVEAFKVEYKRVRDSHPPLNISRNAIIFPVEP